MGQKVDNISKKKMVFTKILITLDRSLWLCTPSQPFRAHLSSPQNAIFSIKRLLSPLQMILFFLRLVSFFFLLSSFVLVPSTAFFFGLLFSSLVRKKRPRIKYVRTHYRVHSSTNSKTTKTAAFEWQKQKKKRRKDEVSVRMRKHEWEKKTTKIMRPWR